MRARRCCCRSRFDADAVLDRVVAEGATIVKIVPKTVL